MRAWSRARDIFRRQGDQEYEGWALNRVALVHREQGELEHAAAEFEEALELQRAAGMRRNQQVVLGNLALVQIDLGALDSALAERIRPSLQGGT